MGLFIYDKGLLQRGLPGGPVRREPRSAREPVRADLARAGLRPAEHEAGGQAPAARHPLAHPAAEPGAQRQHRAQGEVFGGGRGQLGYDGAPDH